jgi:hypothetical protein
MKEIDSNQGEWGRRERLDIYKEKERESSQMLVIPSSPRHTVKRKIISDFATGVDHNLD